MWITIYVVLFAVIFSSNAQEVTNFDVQTATETPLYNQGIEWDSTGPSVTLNIKDGSAGGANRLRNEIPGRPLFYSNQWQPFLMQLGLNNHGDENEYPSNGEDPMKYQFMPTYLYQPHSDQKYTSLSRQTVPSSGFRSPFTSLPIPMAPIAPSLFYPPETSSSSNGYRHVDNSSNLLQNSTASALRSTDARPSSLKDAQGEISPSPRFPTTPGILQRFPPIGFYRNRDVFLPPPTAEFVPPYPILTNTNEHAAYPLVYPYLDDQFFDRETGSGAIENLPEVKNVPDAEEHITTANIRDGQTDEAKRAPSDAFSSFVPAEPFPVPVGVFPFGALPPPILSPIIPNHEASRALNPIIDPISVHKERTVTDVEASQTSISSSIPLDSSTGVLPAENALQQNVGMHSTAEDDIERSSPNEKPAFKIPYEFGFDMNDGKGTDQHRKEVSDVSGTVRGSYGYRNVNGVYRFVNYIADKNGYRAFIKSNEPGVASSGSADVVVMAEMPPPNAIAEGLKVVEPESLIVEDAVPDLIAEGSKTEAISGKA